MERDAEDMQFIGARVEIRFIPCDMSSAFILYDGSHFPIRLTDRNENCHTKRNNLPTVHYAALEGGEEPKEVIEAALTDMYYEKVK